MCLSFQLQGDGDRQGLPDRQPNQLSELQVKLTIWQNKVLRNDIRGCPAFQTQMWKPTPTHTPTHTHPQNVWESSHTQTSGGVVFLALHYFHLLVYFKWSHQKEREKNKNLQFEKKKKKWRQNPNRISVFPLSLWEWVMIPLTLPPSDLFDPVSCSGTVCGAVFRQLKVTICF